MTDENTAVSGWKNDQSCGEESLLKLLRSCNKIVDMKICELLQGDAKFRMLQSTSVPFDTKATCTIFRQFRPDIHLPYKKVKKPVFGILRVHVHKLPSRLPSLTQQSGCSWI